jgi:hypothetical protein
LSHGAWGQKPAAPGGCAAAGTATNAIAVTWRDNSYNETGFKVEAAPASAGPWSLLATVGAGVTNASETGLAPNVTRWYRVRAYNKKGDSAYSNTDDGTTLTPPPPAAPSNLAAAGVSTNAIALSWADNSSDETGFVLEWGPSPNGPWTALPGVGADATAFQHSNLPPATTNFYRIKAADPWGDSPYSAIASGVTLALPAPPSSVAPRGIYLLGDKSGGGFGLVSACNKPFIDGFTARVAVTGFIKSDGGYDFSALDAAVAQLQAMDKGLTVELFMQSIPATWLAHATDTFLVDPIGSDTNLVRTACPWDAGAFADYSAFVSACASHLVRDAATGQMVPFRDHPTLKHWNASLMGLMSVRDGATSQTKLVNHPNYTRERFKQAVLSHVKLCTDQFPRKVVFLGYFAMTDSTASPPLDSVLIPALCEQSKGRLALFQENLRGDAPRTTINLGQNMLAGKTCGLWTMWQACGQWKTHSPCTFTTGDDSPENGFNWGFGMYGNLYYELYSLDLGNAAWSAMFQTWHDFIAAQP